MSVIFTGPGSASLTVTPLPGTVQYGDGHDDRGGGNVPNARAGSARNGSCQVLVDDSSPSEAELLACVSPIGEGDVDVTGTDIDSDMHSYDALVDVEIGGDSVQIATISWKGTISA